MDVAAKETLLHQKLRKAREYTGLTQEEAAEAAGISRETLALWERGERVPGLVYLQRLAQLYQVKWESLLRGPLEPLEGLSVLLPKEVQGVLSPKARLEIQGWLDFLDRYADFLEEEGEGKAYLDRPPEGLRPLGGFLTDARQAPTRAQEVREYYGLGQDAIPELYAFLDQLGILVYRASLGGGEGTKVWGAFYRHPRLGYSVLVNVDSTPGRQVFTLAHELAHGLYHFRLGGIVCRGEDLSPEEREVERYANAWAAHFLVPGKALRALAKGKELFPEDALLLAHHYRVSYTMVLYRLYNEGLISREKLEAWKGYSPEALALTLGLGGEAYRAPEPGKLLGLRRYPPSVLRRVKRAVEGERLSVGEAAGLLDVDSTTLQVGLFQAWEGGTNPEAEELQEALDFISPGRKPKGFRA